MRNCLGALVAVALAIAPAAHAEDSQLQADIAAIEQMSTLGPGASDLGLELSVRRALDSNLGLRVRVRELEAKEARLQASWAPWMPTLVGSWNYNPKREETFREDFETWQRSNSDSGNYSLGANFALFTGSSLSLNWAQGTFGTQVSFDPEIVVALDPDNPIPVLVDRDFKIKWAALSLTFNQNLLQGISPGYHLQGSRLSRLEVDAAEITQDRDMETVVGDVLKAYWDLVAARRLVEIQRIDRRLAEEQRTVTEARIGAGDQAPIELLRIDERVATSSAALLEAERAAEEADQQVKLLMGVDPHDDWYDSPLRPVDGIASTLPARAREASVAVALDGNPDLKLQRIQVEANRIAWRAARHEMLPNLDLNASLALTGRDFEAAAAVDEVFAGGQPDFQVGMTFSMPVPDLGAVHGLRAADLEAEAAEVRLEQAEREVRAGVESSLRSVLSYEAQVDVAKVRITLAAKTAEAAEATYQAGRNTLREVLEAQAGLKEARQALVQAQVNELKARVDLEVVRGTLIETLGIELL